MKIIYATDLHGHTKKYQMIHNLIHDGDYDLCIIGSDILPKHNSPILEKQQKFIRGYLSEFFSTIPIPIIIDFGNDDLKCLYPLFEEVVNRFEHVYISHMKIITVNDMTFVGMHFVPDYPFGLKDWCRLDGKYGIIKPHMYIHSPVYSTIDVYGDGGLKPIQNIEEYFGSHPNISEYLDLLRIADSNFIFLSHSPPRTIGLDITASYEAVGSNAITNFILDKKPIISLHGHIHESPYFSDITINKLNQTICIQPGQVGAFQKLIYCEFDTNNVEETYIVKEIEWKNK